jgi:hypothetical protein
MSRGFYDFILRLIERVESLLIKGTIALIILVITVQVALNDPLHADLNFRDLPVVNKVVSYLDLRNHQYSKSTEVESPSKAVLEREQGIIELKVLNLSEKDKAKVKILVNNQLQRNFGGGAVRLFVQDGDKIILDTREVNQGLWFEVTDSSNNIQSYQKGEQFWIKNNIKELETVELKRRY